MVIDLRLSLHSVKIPLNSSCLTYHLIIPNYFQYPFFWPRLMPGDRMTTAPMGHKHTMQDGWCVDRKHALIVFLSHC
jgi:hypothetical protein